MTDPTPEAGRKALAAIMEGLEGVTAGPWFVENNVQQRGWIQLVTEDFEFGIPTVATDLNGRDYKIRHRSFNHIARCDPYTFRAIAALVAEQDKRIAELEAEQDRCHKRLEIDVAWRLPKEGDELEPFTIPMAERATFPDGISARDETIRILEEQLSEARRALGGDNG